MTAALLKLKNKGLNIQAVIDLKKLSSSMQSHLPQQAKTLFVLGHGGTTLWNNIHHITSEENPIDSFVIQEILEFGLSINENLISKIYFPHKSLTLPLQQLGRELNLCHPSRLGIDIHEHFGLWFAFRAVFVTEGLHTEVLPLSKASPCESCSSTPCLNNELNFNQRRLSCPIGNQHRYSDEQIDYHTKVAQQLF